MLTDADFKPAEAPDTKTAACRMPVALWRALKQFAKARGAAPSSVMRRAIAEAIGYKGRVE